jgi:hypothetical protein
MEHGRHFNIFEVWRNAAMQRTFGKRCPGGSIADPN